MEGTQHIENVVRTRIFSLTRRRATIKRRYEQNGVCRTARARSGGKCRNAAARKDRLTAEVRGPKWFDVKNELNEQERETETDKDEMVDRGRQAVRARQRGRRKRLRATVNVYERNRERESNIVLVGRDTQRWWEIEGGWS